MKDHSQGRILSTILLLILYVCIIFDKKMHGVSSNSSRCLKNHEFRYSHTHALPSCHKYCLIYNNNRITSILKRGEQYSIYESNRRCYSNRSLYSHYYIVGKIEITVCVCHLAHMLIATQAQNLE